MFLVKKIVAPFLIPPGILVAILLLVGLWLLAAGRRRAGAFNLVLGILAWATATVPVADWAARPLERGMTVPAMPPQGDVIILLGSSIREGAPDLAGRGTPSEDALVRIVAAVRLQRQTGLPVIVSGGPVFPGRPSMGPIYRRFLVDLGVPPARILLEERSRDTLENARFSKALCDREGYRQPLVVTHAGHMPRALWCFAQVGLPATAVPCGFQTWEGRRYGWSDILPRGYDRLGQALYEHLGMLFYRLAA